jgi:flagellar motor component MotA
MVCMIILKVKLLRDGQINLGHVPEIGSALVSTILGIFTNTATVK